MVGIMSMLGAYLLQKAGQRGLFEKLIFDQRAKKCADVRHLKSW